MSHLEIWLSLAFDMDPYISLDEKHEAFRPEFCWGELEDLKLCLLLRFLAKKLIMTLVMDHLLQIFLDRLFQGIFQG